MPVAGRAARCQRSERYDSYTYSSVQLECARRLLWWSVDDDPLASQPTAPAQAICARGALGAAESAFRSTAVVFRQAYVLSPDSHGVGVMMPCAQVCLRVVAVVTGQAQVRMISVCRERRLRS